MDQEARGQGLGRRLFRFVLELGVQMANDYGCIGVCVDAKPDAVEFHERYGFISIDVVEGQSDARPAPIPMFLALRAIREALEVPPTGGEGHRAREDPAERGP